MSSALAILMLFAGGAPSADAQFFRFSYQGSVQKNDGAGTSSSSFMSSSSWFSGSDGQIHKEVSQVRSEMVNDGLTTERTQSKVACVDSLCEQQTLHAMQPSQSYQMPAAVRSILGRMFAPGPMESKAVPSLRGFVHSTEPPAAHLVAVIMRPVPPPTRGDHGFAAMSTSPVLRDMDSVSMFLAIMAMSSFVGVNLFAFFVYLVGKRYGQAAARERALAGLGEPLAPSQATETPLAPAPTNSNAKGTVPTARVTAKAFLLRVYQRALSAPGKDIGIDAGALKSYMLRVYARASTRAE